MDRKATPGAFLSSEETARVEAAIAAAERKTSGEIRVLLARSGGEPLAAAREGFRRLEMHRTAERNGVLIFLDVKNRRFAIWGDEAVDRRVGTGGWERLRDEMQTRFRDGDFAGGLVEAVEEVGEILGEHFPRQEDDVNELPDQVVTE